MGVCWSHPHCFGCWSHLRCLRCWSASGEMQVARSSLGEPGHWHASTEGTRPLLPSRLRGWSLWGRGSKHPLLMDVQESWPFAFHEFGKCWELVPRVGWPASASKHPHIWIYRQPGHLVDFRYQISSLRTMPLVIQGEPASVAGRTLGSCCITVGESQGGGYYPRRMACHWLLISSPLPMSISISLPNPSSFLSAE